MHSSVEHGIPIRQGTVANDNWGQRASLHLHASQKEKVARICFSSTRSDLVKQEACDGYTAIIRGFHFQTCIAQAATKNNAATIGGSSNYHGMGGGI